MATGDGAAMTTEQFVARLAAALGDALEAVVLFGSAARDEQHAGHSDVNLLVLLRRLGTAELGASLADAVAAWVASGHPAPLVMTSAEFRRSTDIFAMEVADILARHRVLHGTAPFAGLAVQPRDLRVQLEREAMGKLLKLRGAILSAGGHAERQRVLLARSHSSFVVLFRAAERLAGGDGGQPADGVIRSVAARVGFDAGPWLAVAAHRRGAPLADPAGVLAGVLAGAEKLAGWVDVFPTGG